MNPLRLLRSWRLRLRSLVRTSAVDSELDREFAFHFDQLVLEKTAEGLPPDEARQAAHRALGNVAALKESSRDQRGVTWIHDLQQDVVYGLRILRKQPGFTATAAMSLALGIGANAAVLGAINAVIVQGVQVPHADRFVAIQTIKIENPSQTNGASLPDYAAWRDRSQAFEAIDASIKGAHDLAADDNGAPERITGQRVTSGWLSALGIPPLYGRVFTEAESGPQQSPAIVISYGFWQRRFGGNPGVLNTQVRVDSVARTIIGVMPATFRYQQPDVDYWAPLYVSPEPDAGARLFGVRARLKPGVTIAQAQAELDGIAARLAAERPDHKGWGVQVQPLDESLFGWTREPLFTLEGAVALVLFIACANVAAMLLSRASVRQHEMALRIALGAGRGRIIRQLLAESVLLSLIGGALGLLVAWLGLHALMAMTTPPGSPPLVGTALNGSVLGLMALLTILTGLGCGILPAITGSQLNPIVSLKDPGSVAGPARRRTFPRGVLVSVQLALALVLLIGAGLLMNSFVRLARRDLNFDPAGLVRFDYGVPTTRYLYPIGSYNGFPYFKIDPPPSQILQQVIERVRTVRGVESVAGISSPPVDSFVLATMEVALDPSSTAATSTSAASTATYFIVTPNLFHTIGTPIVHGRDFTERDTVTTPWTAIVNETAARHLWPGEDPIGKRLTLNIVPEEQPREVIGVVRDIPTRHAESPQPVIYGSYLQQPSRYRAPWPGLLGQMTFMIRTADPATLIPAVRRAIAKIDPNRPLADVGTVESHMSNAMGKFRYYVLLVCVFAATATLLAAIGTYGVMSYSVSQRTREIGIRRALGASRADITALVGRRAAALVAIGLVAGIGTALALTQLIASQLWGVTPTDPLTFAAVTVLLVVVAAVACIVPTRRAMAVDPTISLRAE